MIEVTLDQPDDFLKVKETLSRIGVASRNDNKLFQSCHILHKQGRYYIVHFKELFALDGKPTNFSENDEGRRNTISHLLQEWGLVKIDRGETEENDPRYYKEVRDKHLVDSVTQEQGADAFGSKFGTGEGKIANFFKGVFK